MDLRGDPWGKTIWDPKLKIPVFPHYNPPVTFKFPLEFGGYLLKIPVDGGDALIEGKGGAVQTCTVYYYRHSSIQVILHYRVQQFVQ